MLLKSETSDVGSRRLGVVAWLADAARPFRIVRIQTHFDQLLALVWPMVVNGAGRSTHSLVPAAVSCADAAWIPCEHLPAAPPVPGGGVGVAVWATLPLRLTLAVLAFAPGLDEVRASCSRTDFEHDDEPPASDACPRRMRCGWVAWDAWHVLGTSPAKFPRPAPAIHGLPARVVSPSLSASCAMPAPRVARGSMPNKI